MEGKRHRKVLGILSRIGNTLEIWNIRDRGRISQGRVINTLEHDTKKYNMNYLKQKIITYDFTIFMKTIIKI